jgi:hypothetical protein
VFASTDWLMMGFAVIAPDWKEHANTVFKIRENPPTLHLVTLLESKPPPDEASAARWFEILAGRIPGLSSGDIDTSVH